jgi:CRISPR-associated endonuclease Csn1
MKNQRLGLDIGTNSIGYALLDLNESNEVINIDKLGVRIFSDGRNPKDKTSLATARRAARQMRRQRDRTLQRKKLVLNTLIKMGLFPKDKAEQKELKKLNVLELRSLAVQDGIKLKPFELGRAILHLSKSRGFKSGRKETTEKRDTKLSAAMQALELKLEESKSKSYGDFLFKRMQQGLATSATVEAGFYPTRDILLKEFLEILNQQKSNFSNISESQWEKLNKNIFHQRPLRAVEVGKCSLYIEKDRSFQFMPSFEIYRLLGNLHNLRWRDENLHEQGLNAEQIKKCLEVLKYKSEIKYSEIRKTAGLDAGLKFTIESRTKSEKIKGCPTFKFMGLAKKGLINEVWSQLTLEQMDLIAEKFFLIEEKDDLLKELKSLNFLNDQQLNLLTHAEMPGHSDTTVPFSKEALQKIVELSMQDSESPLLVLYKLRKEELNEGFTESLDYYGKAIPDSVVPISSHIAKHSTSINKDELQFGKIANPTVHIGLNQLRKVVNEIIKEYGKPSQIHIEFARDLKLSKDQKNAILKNNKGNEAINDKAKAFIMEYGMKPTSFNMDKVKLWFELENKLECHCVYTGKKISQDMILSEAVEIDHILPFSRTLDDSFMNKVLVLAEANRNKKNQTPFEAFGSSNQWPAILERAKKLPDAKSWKFSEHAMAIFSKNNDFLARQLTDTSYLSKIAKKYLKTILPEEQIVTSPGRLTALVRGKLGMNSLISENSEKNRADHRHHAIDALVVGLVDRSLLNRMSKASEENRQRITLTPPWEGFHAAAKEAVEKILVSHKLDHSPNAAFVEQTGFGLREPKTDYEIENNFKMVTTKALSALKDSDAEKIVSDELRKKAVDRGLESLVPLGVKKLRIYEVKNEDFDKIGSDKSSMVKVQHGENNEHYICYKKDGTHKLCIWKVPVKKDSDDWNNGVYYNLEFTFHYNFDSIKFGQDLQKIKPHPAAKFLLEIHNGDTVQLERDGKLDYFIVNTMSQSNKTIGFVGLNSSKGQKSEDFFKTSITRLQFIKFRKVKISASGTPIRVGPVL